MNSYILVFLLALQVISYACASSSGRYNQAASQPRTHERHRRMHTSASSGGDCMYTICEHVINYPESKVDDIVKQHTGLHSYFAGSVMEPSSHEPLNIGSRHNKEPPTPFCRTKDVTVAPRAIEDVDGVKRTITNTGNYSQVLKYQICDYEFGESCYPGKTLNYVTACMQKFYDIKLVTVVLETNALEYRKFSIPSTCVCTYTKP